MSLQSLSIVIPSYCSRYLPTVLRSIQVLHPLEIIVVDSSPQKPELSNPNASLVHVNERCNPAKARNLGAKRAQGQYLLFLDSDVALPPETIAFIEQLDFNTLDSILFGPYDTHYRATNSFSHIQTHFLYYRLAEYKESRRFPFWSSHLIIKKDVFEQVGGFNEEQKTYEDMEFSARCLSLGYRPIFRKEFRGIHLKYFSYPGLLRDYLEKSFNATEARLRYPAVFKDMPSLIDWKLKFSWFAGVVMPVVILLAYLLAWSVGVTFAIICCFFLAPYPIIRRILSNESRFLKLSALLLWPTISIAIALAMGGGAVTYFLKRLCYHGLFLWDLVVAAKRIFWRNGMPVQIVAYVTARCNLRCEHCFYKETLDAPDPGELPLAVFDQTTRSIGSVLWFSLGGGEPFLRRDLDQLIEIIQRNCRPKFFSFPTNGWYTERSFELSLKILQRLKRGNLILFYSLDGPKDVHDEIRGSGSFERVKATIQRLRRLESWYPNFYQNVVTTVTERNAHTAAQFIDQLVHEFKPSAISINLFRYHSLRHPPIPEYVIEGYKAAVDRYGKYLREGALKHYGFFGGRILLFKELLQKDLIYRVARYDEFVTPCTAGTLSYVIMEDGRVRPCEILPDTLGSVTDTTQAFANMIKTKKAQELRRWIRDTKCRCTYECAMSTNTLFSWPMSKRLTRAVIRDFSQ